MQTIEYRALYTGMTLGAGKAIEGPAYEVIRVQARDVNSGFAKALKQARCPLGNGTVRELGSIEFWQVVA